MSKLSKARASAARLRQRVKSGETQRTLSAFAAGVVVGTMERSGVLKSTLMGVPTKPLISTVLLAYGSRASVGSMSSNVSMGAGHGIAGAYGYATGKAGTLIAGMDGDDDEETLD